MDAQSSSEQEQVQDNQTENTETTSNKKHYLRRFFVIGGLALLVLGLALYFSPQNPPTEAASVETEVTDQYFKPLPAPDFGVGEGIGSAASMYRKALNAYGQEEYEQAITLFDQVLADPSFSSESVPEASLYLGISLLETKQPQRALMVMEPFELHPDFKHEVRWYQALGFIQLDQRENILHTLFSIARDPEHPHVLEAQELLREFVPDMRE